MCRSAASGFLVLLVYIKYKQVLVLNQMGIWKLLPSDFRGIFHMFKSEIITCIDVLVIGNCFGVFYLQLSSVSKLYLGNRG